MTNATGANNPEQYFDVAGYRVYPCRCGVTHSGIFAAEDYAHHNCLHDTVLLVATEQAICQDCGASFKVVYPMEGESCGNA